MWMMVVMSLLGWPLRSCRAGFRVPEIKILHVSTFFVLSLSASTYVPEKVPE